MEETKDITPPKEGKEINPNTVGSLEPNISNIGNLRLNDLEVQAQQESLISKANEEQATVVPVEDVKIEDLDITSQKEQEKIEKVKFGKSGVIGIQKSKYHDQYRKIFLISFFVILISGIASVVLRLYSRYMYFAAQPVINPAYQTYIDTYKQWQQFLDKTLNLSNYQQYTSLSLIGADGQKNVDAIIEEKNLSYIQKKDILQQALNWFSAAFVSDTEKLTTLKENISKYGFFSEELFYLLEDQSYTTSIKKYLLSLEIIKFSSAIKVFSYLDTFVSSLANALKTPVATVQTNMDTFAARGEKDILVYLNNCYLNPYEIDYDCNLVGDFDRYYTLVDNETTKPDTNFFKKMMYYVDNKLEQTDLPSFSITFKKYDPTQKQISFSVDVNTFKQDELALIKRGIINPHIFILSNLLNLIKQSVFVVSENIDAKSIKIESKVIKIGSSVFNVNNSTLDFVLPIQKWSQREITDYIDPIFIYSE